MSLVTPLKFLGRWIGGIHLLPLERTEGQRHSLDSQEVQTNDVPKGERAAVVTGLKRETFARRQPGPQSTALLPTAEDERRRLAQGLEVAFEALRRRVVAEAEQFHRRLGRRASHAELQAVLARRARFFPGRTATPADIAIRPEQLAIGDAVLDAAGFLPEDLLASREFLLAYRAAAEAGVVPPALEGSGERVIQSYRRGMREGSLPEFIIDLEWRIREAHACDLESWLDLRPARAYAAVQPKGGKPTKAWMNGAQEAVDNPEAVSSAFVAYLERCEPCVPNEYGLYNLDDDYEYDGPELLRGLIWMAADWPVDIVRPALETFARRCYSSKPIRGLRSEMLGNACVWSLSQLPDGAGIAVLHRLGRGTRHTNIRKRIEAALDTAAKVAGMSRGDLDELTVPVHAFSEDGTLRRQLNGGAAVLTLDRTGAKATLGWRDQQDRPIKAPSKLLQDKDADGVAEVRTLAKTVKADLLAQRDRIERMYLENVSRDAATWRERYPEHPLIGRMCRSLIWRVEQGGDSMSAIWRDGTMEDVEGWPVPIKDAALSLWHPAIAGLAESRAWRQRLQQLGIVQPFRQAWRESYAPTDAERETSTYSNRFAGHVLQEPVMFNLARINRWNGRRNIGANLYEPFPLHIAIPAHEIYAEYWTRYVDAAEVNAAHADPLVTTDRVAFYRLRKSSSVKPEALRGDPLSVDEVPPIAFSEVMRHCDLFVSVSSIGLDPDWSDAGPQAQHATLRNRDAGGYRQSYVQAELTGTGLIRREMLEQIIPMLKLADRLELDGRYLRVRGTLHTYLIHLGSAAVQLEADRRHICIVPKSTRSADKVALPFQGDNLLSTILAKAILLAQDKKISDPVIRSQIA